MSEEQRIRNAEHCRKIAAHGGAAVYAKYGSHHMRALGKAGARATIKAHGAGYFLGVMKLRGWSGRRHDDVLLDLAYGETLAQLEG